MGDKLNSKKSASRHGYGRLQRISNLSEYGLISKLVLWFDVNLGYHDVLSGVLMAYFLQHLVRHRNCICKILDTKRSVFVRQTIEVLDEQVSVLHYELHILL